jgi:ubiquinone/menaquinone biosynthesis C-methylase UbiE
MTEQERFQLEGNAAHIYEEQKVPAMFRPLAELTLRNVEVRRGDRVLDVACGTGIVGRLAAQHAGGAGKVVGIDLNASMIEVARAAAPETDRILEWHVGDAGALPFPDASLELALCQQGLQFFPDKLRALKEIRRVLVPGGRVALTVWSSVSPFFAALADALTRYVSIESATRSLAPFTFRDPEVIRALMVDAGFQAIDMKILMVERQLGPMEESLPKEIAGTPFGQDVAKTGRTTQAALVKDVDEALRHFRVGDCFTIPQHTHLVRASSGK